ncbi:NHLP family bacteriocin export ABC transporter peptidase/permease/ATPase subunit [Rhizobium sp. RU36D]|uniref:NHLP family bacteriocin export ABC transporter peptidase/permease/ATPase subunit n=1 Tax=Rhizobium sp. RU36D TaxID=1907415 RepID=UPI0009D8331B|nr:NHLP family bacteriocin export ABC transporter peptidase/permease/ATPase subunit [Rhizobium sp. RU36D]SMC70505.1 NHLM bacteriocin system ABC transporter, peptidase/ATP-binding protein [Rhizobium sp. RU36D]
MTVKVGAKPRRKRTPTIFQMDAVECGAASLAMVLAAHGRWVPLPELREACGVSRDGSLASNIVRAARRYGLEAKGFRCEPEHMGDFAMPAIAFINLNHFVVLEGWERGRFWLNDPAAGRRALSREEFSAVFSGVLLTCKPGPEFRREGRRPGLWRDLTGLLDGLRLSLMLALLAGLALILPGLVVPAATQIFIDHYLIDGQQHWMPVLLAVLVVTGCVQAALSWLKDEVLLRLRARIAVVAAVQMVWRMVRLPTRFFTQRHAGALAGRVELARQLGVHAGAQLPDIVLSVISCLFFLLVMLAYSPLLTLVTVACTAATLLIFALSRLRLEEAGRKVSMTGIRLYGRTMQGIGMIESLKASGADGAFFSQWSGYLANMVRERQALGRIQAILGALPESLMLFNQAVVLILSAWLVARGEMSVGMLAAFQALIGAFAQPLNTLVEQAAAIKQARGTLDQFDDVATAPMAWEFENCADTGLAEASATGRVSKLAGAVAVRGLAFGYNPLQPPLVQGFDLDLPPGARVALVGASGSGKSTIGRLVCGLFDPWEGEILLDSQPIKRISRTVLRDSVAFVDQDIVLFEGSVRDNITLWDETMPESRVVRAARDATIHDDIVARSGGYGAAVEEGGRNWSGGQRQRLEIARALVAEPSILVLDEATSALDPVVEKELMDNIRRRGCTCLIIAHRLSTIRDCDEIVVMDKGKVVERGLHEALMANDGPYRRLVES